LTILQTLEIFSLENKSFIMKSNARYFIFNWKLIIDRLPKDFDFAAWPSPDLNFLETGFYVAKVKALVKGLPPNPWFRNIVLSGKIYPPEWILVNSSFQ
jgi:hypothetical protein